jgi:hypothetical protein
MCHINTVGTIVEGNGARIETYKHVPVRYLLCDE